LIPILLGMTSRKTTKSIEDDRALEQAQC